MPSVKIHLSQRASCGDYSPWIKLLEITHCLFPVKRCWLLQTLSGHVCVCVYTPSHSYSCIVNRTVTYFLLDNYSKWAFLFQYPCIPSALWLVIWEETKWASTCEAKVQRERKKLEMEKYSQNISSMNTAVCLCVCCRLRLPCQRSGPCGALLRPRAIILLHYPP